MLVKCDQINIGKYIFKISCMIQKNENQGVCLLYLISSGPRPFSTSNLNVMSKSVTTSTALVMA